MNKTIPMCCAIVVFSTAPVFADDTLLRAQTVPAAQPTAVQPVPLASAPQPTVSQSSLPVPPGIPPKPSQTLPVVQPSSPAPPPPPLPPLRPPTAPPVIIVPPPPGCLPPGPPRIVQAKKRHKRRIGGIGMLMIGTSTMTKLDSLNASLEANGYTKLEPNNATIGGSGFAIVKRFLIGGEGHAFGGRQTSANGILFSSNAAYGLIDIGYLLIASRSFLLYPVFGIGAGGFTLQFTDQTTASFGDLLANPKRTSTASSTSAIISIGLGANFIINLRDEESGRIGGLTVGLRLGFLQASPNSSWSHMMNGSAAGGPDTGITGPYLGVTIGGIGVEMP